MKKRKILIDADPGIDDAYAIALAIKEPSFEVLGLHTVSGNVSIEHTTRNGRGLLHSLNSNVPVYKGAHRPLCIDPIFAGEVHGANGLAGYQFEETALNPLDSMTSLQAYYDVLSKTEDPITIIAIGPLTNLALLIKTYPELISKIECLSIMGGGLKGGNITIPAEFNFYVDPHAAKIVFESGIPIIMAGLDVTEQSRLYDEDIDVIKEKAGKIGEILHYIAQPGLNTHEHYGIGRCLTLNDAVSVLALTNPEIFTMKDYEVHIITEGEARGLSIANTRLRDEIHPNTKVILDVDKNRFRELLIEKLGDH